MKEEAIIQLLNKVGYIPQSSNGEWVQVSCPLAHLHPKKSDENPSCGISVNEEEESIVHCFVCGTRPLGAMLATMVYTHNIDREAIRFYLEHEIIKDNTPSIDFIDKFISKEKETPTPVPDNIVQAFKPLTKPAKDYLRSRGIDPEKTRNIFVLDNKLVFLIKDLDFKTYWLHARPIGQHKFFYLTPKDFGLDIEWGRKDSWYNIENIDFNKPIYAVEGELDCEKLITLGVENVIASHGPVTVKKLQRLSLAKLVYAGFDSDESGQRFNNMAKKHLKCKVVELDWSIVGCKDPCDLKSRQDLDKVLEAAQKPKTVQFKDKYELRRRVHGII
jgi:5S rRNA maturation endonuclease (ribonuclease M5)